MPYMHISELEFYKLLSYLKPAFSNLSNCKIFQNKKFPKVGTKNALVWYFRARILKNYCDI